MNTSTIAEGDEVVGCDDVTIYFYGSFNGGNFDDDLEDGSLRITRDGAVVASSTDEDVVLTESGEYSFEWVNDNLNFDCSVTSVTFTVTISEVPTTAPALTSTGDLEFCAEDGEVTLTAPAGFSQYRWLRNGATLNNSQNGFEATSNTLVERNDRIYSVQVGNNTSCFSPVSNTITLNVRALPGVPGFSQSEATCGEGPVTFSFSGSRGFSYQLINAFTGQPSGAPEIGSGNGETGSGTTFITSESISETTEFYLQVSYVDGSGCSNAVSTNEVVGQPNNVVLEAEGLDLVADISGTSTLRAVRWFRNGVLLRNRTQENEFGLNINTRYFITVTDAAEYSVEVDFEGAGICTITSNSIDLSGSVVTPGGSTGGRIEANSYPNPSQGDVVNIDIKGDNFGKYQINIMTLTGQVLVSVDAEKDTVEFSEQVDIAKLERGIYNIQVIRGNEFKNIRYIIQ